MTRTLLLLLSLGAIGCGGSATKPVDVSSTQFATIEERAEFLHQHVGFRRTYETLDYHVFYADNSGGGMPGPSDWDITVVATVPEDELDDWVPDDMIAVKLDDTRWLEQVPTKVDTSGISKWYLDDGDLVGIDRENRVVVFRDLAM